MHAAAAAHAGDQVNLLGHREKLCTEAEVGAGRGGNSETRAREWGNSAVSQAAAM
jgi:hypothetical protein